MKTATQYIAQTLNLNERPVAKTVELLQGGATIPFIARYRKEATGGLDELQIAEIQRQLSSFEALEKRKATILGTIEELGRLTPDLKLKIEDCWVEAELEDIYLPYKPKRKTKAEVARQQGLEGLAKILMAQRERDAEYAAHRFVRGEVESATAALEGARHIIAEWVNENPKTRDFVRSQLERFGRIESKLVKGKETEAQKYRDYFSFDEALKRAPAHRILALNRGESEGYLRVRVRSESEERLIENISRYYVKGSNESSQQVALAVKDAYKRLLQPSLETELRKKAKEKADADSIKVFAENLRHLLMESPLGQKRTLAIDPGFRTGCKVVCLDEQGNLLHNETIFPHPPQKEAQKAQAQLEHLIKKYRIEAIAIGDGTAGRETEALVKRIVASTPLSHPNSTPLSHPNSTPSSHLSNRALSEVEMPKVFMVNEDGASVYSASAIAREEFPDHDVTVRGAVSIGRRLMDPLAELIKIDPKSLGIGQYQHDVDQKLLKQELDWVVESCVNAVGVNLNTASKHLLTYVSGLGPKIAENVVAYRQANGGFTSRTELKKVAGLGPKAFEQCAGFLRIPDAKNPLDRTAVHPERYALVKQMLSDHGISTEKALFNAELVQELELHKYVNPGVGLPTLQDIVKELAKPGRDPREGIKEFSFDPRLKDINDVQEGMVLPGLVGNVTNFGAFVNIGIKESGLVHVSHLANRYVSNPAEVVKLNQQVTVKVLSVDLERKRIQLSMKEVDF